MACGRGGGTEPRLRTNRLRGADGSAGPFLTTLNAPTKWLGPVEYVFDLIWPFRSFNRYGLFAVMTTRRLEIVLEGSADGSQWLPYEFPWKPGDPTRRPGFVAPHQPR